MAWTIEAKILPLVGIAGHLYIDVFNDAGERVEHLNGISTCPKTGVTHAIGRPGDLIKAYTNKVFSLSACFNATRDKHPHKGEVIFSGTEEDVKRALEAAYKKIDDINKLNLPYKLLSQNSNSVFTSLVEAMAEEVAIDKTRVESVIRLKFHPGVRKKLA